jgi:hypothetical protein
MRVSAQRHTGGWEPELSPDSTRVSSQRSLTVLVRRADGTGSIERRALVDGSISIPAQSSCRGILTQDGNNRFAVVGSSRLEQPTQCKVRTQRRWKTLKTPIEKLRFIFEYTSCRIAVRIES